MFSKTVGPKNEKNPAKEDTQVVTCVMFFLGRQPEAYHPCLWLKLVAGKLVPDRIRWHHIHSLPFVVFFHPKFGVR